MSSSNEVLRLHGGKMVTPDQVLEDAKGEFTDVFVIGYNDENEPTYSHSLSSLTNAQTIYLLESIKLKILNGSL